MFENFINYVGVANLVFILLLILVYILGTKKSIKNLNERIERGIEENRDFKEVYAATGELKKMVDKLKRSNGSLVKNEETKRYEIVKLQNELRKVSQGTTGEEEEQENEEIKILKKEVKILKKVVKRLEEPNQQQKTTTRTP